MLRPAIFFDRDGVLNDIVWRGQIPASPRRLEELKIAVGAADLVHQVRAAGYMAFAVTNQPDVARGLMSATTLNAINAALDAALKLDEIADCRHDNADACACRKPKPGLVLGLAERHGVDLTRSWLIGDQDRDIECGRAAGCKTLLLARPYNSKNGADRVAETLSQAIDIILNAEIDAISQ